MNNQHNQKDNQNRGFQNKGHNGSNAYHAQDKREASMLSPVAKDNFAFILRKSEKLTTALYMVTNIMPEKEPMKWKAREIAVELLSDISMSQVLTADEKMTGLRNAGKKAEKIIAFLDVAEGAHLVSEMNASVLKKEYFALKDAIEGEWMNIYETNGSIFSDSFFDVERMPVLPKIETQKQNPQVATPRINSEAGTVNRVPHVIVQKQKEVTPPVHAPVKFEQKLVPSVSTGIIIEQKHEVMKTSNPSLVIPPRVTQNETFTSPLPPRPVTLGSDVFSRGRSEGDHSDRRKIILALIKQKPALTVKDITRSIPEVSEKTIQRELLAMVSEGVLVKHGERRWSTYSLKTL